MTSSISSISSSVVVKSSNTMNNCSEYNKEKCCAYPLCNGAKDKQKFDDIQCDKCNLYTNFEED